MIVDTYKLLEFDIFFSNNILSLCCVLRQRQNIQRKTKQWFSMFWFFFFWFSCSTLKLIISCMPKYSTITPKYCTITPKYCKTATRYSIFFQMEYLVAVLRVETTPKYSSTKKTMLFDIFTYYHHCWDCCVVCCSCLGSYCCCCSCCC